MALWGAVLSLGIGWESLAYGQQQAPPPVSAANDSLTTTGEEVAPTTDAAGPTEMHADTTAVRRVRRAQDRLRYYIALGVGTAINYLPDSFADSYDPSFGLRLGGGVSKRNVRLGVTASYNFFFTNAPTDLFPDDLNILTVFADLKFVPVGKTIRPYILACGGYWRQWIVDIDYVEGVLGYGGGAGVELEIDRSRQLFIEGRYVQGQTRDPDNTDAKANTETLPFTLGVTWVF
jgi:hypothetical protein